MTSEQISSDDSGLYQKSYSILRNYESISLDINYVGDNDFNSVNYTKNYNSIGKSRTTLTITATKTTLTSSTDSAVLTVTLKDNLGNNIQGETVKLTKGTYELATLVTDVNGQVTYTYPAVEGTATVTATYDGNTSAYDGSNATISMTVSITPTVTKQSSTVTFSPSSASVTSGGSVTFTVTGKGTISIGTSSGASDIGILTDSGTVTYTPSASCTIYAVSSGNDNYYGASASCSITVTPYVPPPSPTYISTSLGISGADTINENTTTTYTVTKNNMPSNSTVSYAVDGTTIGSTTGTTFDLSFSAGTHTITVSYAGSGTYLASSVQKSVTANIVKQDTSISVSASPSSTIWGQGITVTASLGIANQTVSIGIVGDTRTGTTDSNGNFSTTFTETDPCTDTAEANYGGNSRYNGSSSTVNFSYTTRNTHYTNMSSKVSKGGTWKCQLLDQLGSPVVGRHIHVTTVRYNNRSQGADLGWFTTDANGYIETNALTYDFKNEYFGFYPVFDGDSKYVGASDGIWVLYNEAGL